ncbi:MAG: HU family DNA-binding protein [Paludibacteraceae bacterium]|nr:HU family DNA-binding protein [Paludibacteraceae bacterium]
MADKLSWTELRRLLANRAGVSEKEANLFLNAFNAQIVEALKQDKQVKINGLGTFKLQAVAPRKSVNVTTGEEIIIEGYNKIAFTPEVGVKELVEKTSLGADQSPTVSPTTETIDPLQKLGEQAAEIVDLLADLGQAVKEEAYPQPVYGRSDAPRCSFRSDCQAEAILHPEGKGEESGEVKVKVEEVKVEEVKVEEVKVEEVKEKKSHVGRNICIAILLCLLIAGGVGYYFFPQYIAKCVDWAKALIPPTETTCVVTDTISSIQEVVVTDTIAEEIIPNADTCTIEVPIYEELITIEPMHRNSRLAWMAMRYYGAKIYWPYLYDANKDCINNPNDIEVGTPIRVPRLTEAQLDTTLQSTINTLQYLREQAIEASHRN